MRPVENSKTNFLVEYNGRYDVVEVKGVTKIRDVGICYATRKMAYGIWYRSSYFAKKGLDCRYFSRNGA